MTVHFGNNVKHVYVVFILAAVLMLVYHVSRNSQLLMSHEVHILPVTNIPLSLLSPLGSASVAHADSELGAAKPH